MCIKYEQISLFDLQSLVINHYCFTDHGLLCDFYLYHNFLPWLLMTFIILKRSTILIIIIIVIIYIVQVNLLTGRGIGCTSNDM